MITEEVFKKHTDEDQENFAKIYAKLTDIDMKRGNEHDEIMKMLQPIYDAFSFKNKLSKEAMAGIVKWTKVIGFLLSVIALLGVVWKFLLYNIPK